MYGKQPWRVSGMRMRRMERGNKTAGGGRSGKGEKKKRRDRYELRNIIGLSYDRDCVVSVWSLLAALLVNFHVWSALPHVGAHEGKNRLCVMIPVSRQCFPANIFSRNNGYAQHGVNNFFFSSFRNAIKIYNLASVICSVTSLNTSSVSFSPRIVQNLQLSRLTGREHHSLRERSFPLPFLRFLNLPRLLFSFLLLPVIKI